MKEDKRQMKCVLSSFHLTPHDQHTLLLSLLLAHSRFLHSYVIEMSQRQRGRRHSEEFLCERREHVFTFN
jgi:hypothetical protein